MFKKRVPNAVLLLGFVSFFNDTASEMLYPIMPIFLTQVLGAPVFIVGIIEGVAEGLSSILKTVFGMWSDRLAKRKPFIFYGYLSSACSKLIIASSYTWPLVFIGRLVDRFGKGLRTGARDALLLESTDEHNKGLIFGIHRSMDTAGAVFGPLIALLLIQIFKENIRFILYIAAIPAFFGLIFFLFLKDSKKQVKTTKTTMSFSLKNASPQLKQFLLVLALFSIGNSSDIFLILRVKEIGLGISSVIFVYALYNFTYAAFSIPAGRISDKIGSRKVFTFGMLIYALIYFAFALNKHSSFVWLLFAVYGLYIAATDGVSKALVGTLIDKREAGTAYGLMQTVMSICTLLASVIGGFLWSIVRPEATFIFSAICALAASVLFISQKKLNSKVFSPVNRGN